MLQTKQSISRFAGASSEKLSSSLVVVCNRLRDEDGQTDIKSGASKSIEYCDRYIKSYPLFPHRWLAASPSNLNSPKITICKTWAASIVLASPDASSLCLIACQVKKKYVSQAQSSRILSCIRYLFSLLKNCFYQPKWIASGNLATKRLMGFVASLSRKRTNPYSPFQESPSLQFSSHFFKDNFSCAETSTIHP